MVYYTFKVNLEVNQMGKKIINLGLDIGNYDVKTVNTSTPSGFNVFTTKPYGVSEYLLYEGKYYIPSMDRFAYVQDKTKNENAFVMSLFGISKELIARAKKKAERQQKKAEETSSYLPNVINVQDALNETCTLNLGVGVPPTHYATLAQKTIDYYKEHFSGPVVCEFNGYMIEINLNFCQCYPQDIAAVCGYVPKKKDDSVINFSSYYAIDIGGWTVDVITFINNELDNTKCDSKPLGILPMYESIIKHVEEETGKRITKDIIGSILAGKPTLVPEGIKDFILNDVKNHIRLILGELAQFGLSFDLYPTLFIGGGSLLFRKYINEVKDEFGLIKYEFIENPNANALGYEKLIRQTNNN